MKNNFDIMIHDKLIENLKDGSYSAFDQLYAIYSDLLYGFALNITKSTSDAKDVVQDTFVKIWQTRENLSPEKSFKSYLFTIAKNQITDKFRHNIHLVSFEAYIGSDSFQEKAINNVEQNIFYDEFLEKLNQAKEKMTPQQKKIFNLCKEQGHTIEEAAKQLNLSEKTIRNTLSLALNVIKSELGYLAILFPALFIE